MWLQCCPAGRNAREGLWWWWWGQEWVRNQPALCWITGLLCVVGFYILWVQEHRLGRSLFLHLPVPECRSDPQCVRDYVRICGLVSDPPPLFDFERDFMPTFGVYARKKPGGVQYEDWGGGYLVPTLKSSHGDHANAEKGGRDVVRFVIVPHSASPDGVYAMGDTWARPDAGWDVSFVISDHMDGVENWRMPPADRIVVIPNAGVGSNIERAPRPVLDTFSNFASDGMSYEERMKQNDAAHADYLWWEFRCIKAFRRIYADDARAHPWFFFARDAVLPFPDKIVRLAESVLDPDIPLIISYLQSTQPVENTQPVQGSTTQDSVHVERHTASSTGMTYATLDVGMIMSRGALEILAKNLGEADCPFVISADATVSRCAWRTGIYLATHPHMKPFLGWDDGLGNEEDIRVHVNGTQKNPLLEESVDFSLCTRTLSVHAYDIAYRSRYMECNLFNKYYLKDE